jgi:hypothetical protein
MDVPVKDNATAWKLKATSLAVAEQFLKNFMRGRVVPKTLTSW